MINENVEIDVVLRKQLKERYTKKAEIVVSLKQEQDRIVNKYKKVLKEIEPFMEKLVDITRDELHIPKGYAYPYILKNENQNRIPQISIYLSHQSYIRFSLKDDNSVYLTLRAYAFGSKGGNQQKNKINKISKNNCESIINGDLFLTNTFIGISKEKILYIFRKILPLIENNYLRNSFKEIYHIDLSLKELDEVIYDKLNNKK